MSSSCAPTCTPVYQSPDLCEIVITPNGPNWLILIVIAAGIWFLMRDDGSEAHQKKKQKLFDSVI
jgi:hypothetical protein